MSVIVITVITNIREHGASLILKEKFQELECQLIIITQNCCTARGLRISCLIHLNDETYRSQRACFIKKFVIDHSGNLRGREKAELWRAREAPGNLESIQLLCLRIFEGLGSRVYGEAWGGIQAGQSS